MNRHLLSTGLIVLASCVGSGGSNDASSGGRGCGASLGLGPSYLPAGSLSRNWGDGGPSKDAALLVPRRDGDRWTWSAFQISSVCIIREEGETDAHLEERARRNRNEVSAPWQVVPLDPVTGEIAGPKFYMNAARRLERYGLPDPPGWIVGHLDDPRWLPPDRVEMLRARIYKALDVLAPFFADEDRAWTEAANVAAQEIRDFFPLAAEPGLWPYYQAEGKEFFTWIEKNAPPAKAPLPWDEPRR